MSATTRTTAKISTTTTKEKGKVEEGGTFD